MKKDTVALICDIGELAGLFERSSSLADFLQTSVSVVAHHIKVAACSIYLYDDDTQMLTLTAAQGLNPAAINHVKYPLGSNAVGVVLKELRPIAAANASQLPYYVPTPELQDAKYTAFLAVPILRGLSRVGVLVLQDPVQDYFDDNDRTALQAIAAQLATVVENAKLLLSLGWRAPSELVFLSYAKEDVQQALRLHDELRSAGIRVWKDDEQLRPGDNWKLKIRKNLGSVLYP